MENVRVAEHFPLENVRQNAFVTFCVTKCDAKIYFCKASNAFVTFCFAKMHFCTNKMYASLFFAKQKTQHFCTAEHFPKENVQHQQNVTNAFDALQKYIFASHFVTQNVTNAFDALQKYIFASHFVTQNVTNAFDAKMHLMHVSHFVYILPEYFYEIKIFR